MADNNEIDANTESKNQHECTEIEENWQRLIAAAPSDRDLERAVTIMKNAHKKSPFSEYVKIRKRNNAIRVRMPHISSIGYAEKDYKISEYLCVEDALKQASVYREMMSRKIHKFCTSTHPGVQANTSTKKGRKRVLRPNPKGVYGNIGFRPASLYFEVKSIRESKLHSHSFPVPISAVKDKRRIAEIKRDALFFVQEMLKNGVEIHK